MPCSGWPAVTICARGMMWICPPDDNGVMQIFLAEDVAHPLGSLPAGLVQKNL